MPSRQRVPKPTGTSATAARWWNGKAALALVRFGFGTLWREAFLPAYAIGAVLAGALALARDALALDSVAVVLGLTAAGIGAAWLAFYAIWMRGPERELVRDLAGGLVPGRRARSGAA